MSSEKHHYFIELANSTDKYIEDINADFLSTTQPQKRLSKSTNPETEINLESFFDCIGPDLCPIGERMIEFMKAFRKSLSNTLDDIIQNKGQVTDSPCLHLAIEFQERLVRKYEIAGGKLVENVSLFPEDKWKIYVVPGWMIFSCRTLIDFLCNGDLQRLRKCPICQKFFIAKDTKRFLCYERECKTKEDQYRKTYYRDMGWDEHGSISADNITLQDPLYKKLKEHWEVNNNKKKRNVR